MNKKAVGEKEVNKKFRLIMALVIALVLSSGVYAYTYTTAMGTIDITEPTGDIATCELAPGQPPWENVMPEEGGGSVGTETLRPNAAGDRTQIPNQYPDSGEHWDKVDDQSPDDWETFIYTGRGQYKTDVYHLTDHSEGSGTINGVTVYFRFAGHDEGSSSYTAYARATIKPGNKYFQGSEETQTGATFVTRSYEWTTNPDTGSAWTWDEIDALQAGVDLRRAKQGGTCYCTQIYVEVDYVYEAPPEICGDVPTGNLFVVTPHPYYTGDLTVKVYLVNTGSLIKAYQYLNMELTLLGADENPQLLTLHNGVAVFSLQGCAGGSHTLSVTGGSYCLVSDDPDEWGDYSITPELRCEVIQR